MKFWKITFFISNVKKNIKNVKKTFVILKVILTHDLIEMKTKSFNRYITVKVESK